MADINRRVTHNIRLQDKERFELTLPTGKAMVDIIMLNSNDDMPVMIQAGGYVIKKDGAVGEARRLAEVTLPQIPASLREIVAALAEER